MVEELNKVENWQNAAFPIQVPIIRVFSHEKYRDSKLVTHIIDSHKHIDNLLFFREVISLGFQCLDRQRIRHLAIETFQNVPDFVQRAIFRAVKDHSALSDDEKRPLLKNMKSAVNDWFIDQMSAA